MSERICILARLHSLPLPMVDLSQVISRWSVLNDRSTSKLKTPRKKIVNKIKKMKNKCDIVN